MQVSRRALALALTFMAAIVLTTGYLSSSQMTPAPKEANLIGSGVSETKVQRILRKANALAREVVKDPKQAELTQNYSSQLKLAVKDEQKAYDLISEDVNKSSEQLKALKDKLNEQIQLNESPDFIAKLNYEFETEAQLLIDKQLQLNEAYKKLQAAQDQAVSDIISQNH